MLREDLDVRATMLQAIVQASPSHSVVERKKTDGLSGQPASPNAEGSPRDSDEWEQVPERWMVRPCVSLRAIQKGHAPSIASERGKTKSNPKSAGEKKIRNPFPSRPQDLCRQNRP